MSTATYSAWLSGVSGLTPSGTSAGSFHSTGSAPRGLSLNTRPAFTDANGNRASIRVLVGEDSKQRDQDDLEIECQAPVLNVVEVVDEAFLDGRLTAEVVGLRPAGEPRPDPVAVAVVGQAALELPHDDRSLRARTDK